MIRMQIRVRIAAKAWARLAPANRPSHAALIGYGTGKPCGHPQYPIFRHPMTLGLASCVLLLNACATPNPTMTPTHLHDFATRYTSAR